MITNNKIRAKMQEGKKVTGAFFGLDSTASVEVLGQAGLDFIMIDTEHGPIDVETASQFVIACELWGMTPFVRVKDHNRNSILKMLDIGAMGLLIPFIKTPDEVRELVGYGKYRPIGDRGFGPTRKNGYAQDPMINKIEDYFEWANRETLLIPQCETVEALESIEEITAIEGVDGIFVGPFDLSVAMGIPKQFSAPVFVEAMQRVLAACKKNGKFCWTLGMTPQDAKAKFEMGFDGALALDTDFLAAGVRQYIEGIKKLGY